MNLKVGFHSREEQAKVEIGVTVISRGLALGAVVIFLVSIVGVMVVDQARGGFRAWRLVVVGDGSARESLHALEGALEEESAVERSVRPSVQRAMALGGVSGVEKIFLGREGWLFYEPDVRHVAGRGFMEGRSETGVWAWRRGGLRAARERDPVGAILDFARQLRGRGIALVVVPTPVKPTTNPEMLWAAARGPVANASFARFKGELRGRGVLVFDPADAGGRFLARDTHWRPEMMEGAAARLAEFVKGHVELPQSLGMEYRREERVVRGRGDLAGMLATPSPLEEVTTSSVIEPGGQLWSPRADAEILWLGDSFSNIYSAEEMGWGAAAGFAEQFSFHLSRPIDAIRRNDNGAFATRQMLADELAARRDRLAGKKLVVWQFAARELSFGDWRLIEMRLGERMAAASQRQWVVPPIGEAWIVSGVVLAKGAAPRPGNVAYRDHILAVHLGDVSVEGRAMAGGKAIVYLRSMIDGKLTEAATLQVGQRVRLRVRDWSEVSRRYEFVNRSDLAEAELRGQAACWGEILR
jgi:hypothetical protein